MHADGIQDSDTQIGLAGPQEAPPLACNLMALEPEASSLLKLLCTIFEAQAATLEALLENLAHLM